jgi:ABC-2 type transport system permease protein
MTVQTSPTPSPAAAHQQSAMRLQYPVRDSATMLRRNLKHMRRYPSMTLMLVGQPIVFLLLFVYVFGGALGRGLPGSSGGRRQYLTYVTPAILIMAVASIALGTAVHVAIDMTGGIIARFRTMDIARVSVLTGHVFGAMIQTGLTLLVVLGTALLLGFRSDASAADWVGVTMLLLLFALALTWLTVALGLVSKSVETASNLPMFLILLPFLGSGFVPTSTMPGWLAWFARNQPFTPIMEAVRGLLSGNAVAHTTVLAIAWSVGIMALGYFWAKRLFAIRHL